MLTSGAPPLSLGLFCHGELSECSGPGKPAVDQDDRDTFSLQHICLGGQSALILHCEGMGWCVAMCRANVTNCPGNVASADTSLEKHTAGHECPGRWLGVLTGTCCSL